MKNSKSFSVLFWTNKAKSDVNGLVPLYARVTVEGKRAEISLKKKLSPRKWDAASGFMKGSGNEVRVINKHINDVGNALYDIYSTLSQCDTGYTAEDIKSMFLGSTPARKRRRTILEVFDEHNADVEKLVGKDYVKATLTKYKTIRDKVEAFIQSRFKREDMFLDELDFVFISAFEKYLKIEDGIEHNTVMGYIKRVKRIMTIAVHNKWVTHNPFLAFKCTTRKITRTHLTDEELTILASRRFAIKRLEEVRDCFLFSCYTGYAFVDASKLTQDNIVIKERNEYWIDTNRTKTVITANVPLLPEAKAIIEKYKGHVLCEVNNKLLPLKSNQKMNAYLKEIADICGIKKNLTTHIARHTFATTVTLGNDVPIETVSKMLGHTKITTTQIYARVQEKKISRDMLTLQRRLADDNKLS